MAQPDFRRLEREEVGLFSNIDRSEVIDGRYSIVDGQLVLEAWHHVVTGWYPSEIEDHPAHILRLIDLGGCAFGAWDNAALVGIAALDPRGVGGDPTTLQLEPLFVSAPYRNRGVGKTLVSMVADAARSLDATRLYISATPTRNTVDAYLRMGAIIATPPDPTLLEREPEDIHLILELR